MALTVNYDSNVIEMITSAKYAYRFKKDFLRNSKNKGVTLIVNYLNRTDEESVDFIFSQYYPQLEDEVLMQERDPSDFMVNKKIRLDTVGKRNISLDVSKHADILYIFPALVESEDGTVFNPVIHITAIDESET
ncbi:MAG: hypothetical protein GY870_14975 [archaeon]|nr:hypothetical protein [archaeon]